MSLILDLKTTEILCSIRIILFDKGYDLTKKGHVFSLRDDQDPHSVVLTKYKGFFLFVTHTYTQYPIIRNGHIRNRAEFLGKSLFTVMFLEKFDFLINNTCKLSEHICFKLSEKKKQDMQQI